MARGLTDPIEMVDAEGNGSENGYLGSKEEREMLYEMQEIVQTLITKHNELFDKVEKLEDKLTDLRIQHEAAKLVWQKGL
jgi:glycogen synthase